jgi:hypothetical protein
MCKYIIYTFSYDCVVQAQRPEGTL